MFDIDVNSLREAINNLAIERTQIKFIIQDFMSQIEGNTQKESELYILGKFINCLNKEQIEIVNAIHESPDFIIKHDNELVGVEIIEAKDCKIIRPKTTDDLLAKAAIKFKDKYPEILVSVLFTFKNYELTITRTNKTILIEELCDAVYNSYLDKNDLPSFIDDITIKKTKSVSFSHYLVGYDNNIDPNLIERLIMKKERLLEKYKINSGIEKQWLIIATSKASPNSFDVENVKEMSFHSKFNRVYLLEEFTSELKRLT